MSLPTAALFIGLGIIILLKPEWFERLERESKAVGTNRDPDEIEFVEWWTNLSYLTGLFSISFGLLIMFNVV